MKKFLRLAVLLLCAILAGSSAVCSEALSGSPDTGDSEYYTYLIGLGFPASYAEKLTELHLLHPTWTIEPLLVSELQPAYTWGYVIYMETQDEPKRSLVSSSPEYSAYRHPTNTTLYDTGWYQASSEAVEYLMDPRNFLNEKDIFQFEDLSYKNTVTLTQVESALAGTFMEGAHLENGKTYAEYFMEVGEELGISPLHLAARARQEQGQYGTGPQVSGTCGDRLWYYYSNQIEYEGSVYVNAPSSGHTEESLRKYNGLYNIYNIGAGGTGKFEIFLNSMEEAQTGTQSMAAEWGGSGAWDTKWKSIYGGALRLRDRYIANYQSTLYLQKWNVDCRSKTVSGTSRNFWGQYMQNIGATLSEARTTYLSLAENNCLDCAYHFLIPVYSGMPGSCPDPAGGNCPAFAAADTKYSYITQLDQPVAEKSSPGGFISTGTIGVPRGYSITVGGWSVHTYGLAGYEYRIDGQGWLPMSASHSPAAAAQNPDYVRCTTPGSLNSFSATIETGGLEAGPHKILLRAKTAFDPSLQLADNAYYLLAAINLEVLPRDINVTTKSEDGSFAVSVYPYGSRLTLPEGQPLEAADTYFAGWTVESEAGRLFLPAGAEITLTEDITLRPIYIDLILLDGAALKINLTTSLRFTAVTSYDRCTGLAAAAGKNNISFGMIFCKTTDLGSMMFHPSVLEATNTPYTRTYSEGWFHTAARSGEYYGYYGNIQTITSTDYQTSFSAVAYVSIKYSNGTSALICTPYDAAKNSRSARFIARAALADTRVTYTSEVCEILGKIAE
ncbi:MAG: N-acetylglucosaminidase [Eubacteriales bacterium]